MCGEVLVLIGLKYTIYCYIFWQVFSARVVVIICHLSCFVAIVGQQAELSVNIKLHCPAGCLISSLLLSALVIT